MHIFPQKDQLFKDLRSYLLQDLRSDWIYLMKKHWFISKIHAMELIHMKQRSMVI